MAEQIEVAPKTPAPAPAAGGGSESMQQMLFMFIPMAMVMYFLLIRPESKRRKEKEALMGGLKAKDKVVTIGGLHATVVEVDAEKDEVVLLVDPKKDVKMKFRRSAIDVIVSPDEKKP